jgi:hypothetical protein
MENGLTGADLSAIRFIGAAVTPAVLVSGCGILAAGLDGQMARLAARMRELLAEWRTLPGGHPRRELLKAEVALLDRRHRLLARALALAYGALLAFVMTSLLYLSQRRFDLPDGLPVAAFTVAVLMLAGLAVFALASLRLGRDAIGMEKREMFMEGELPAPTGERKR